MKRSSPRDNLARIERTARRLGADLVSSAAIGPAERERFHSSIAAVSAGLDRAVVIGVGLAGPAVATCETAPTWTYYFHYRTVNYALDHAALAVALECRRLGGTALPIPASQIMDWDRLRAHLSHREMAALAGLGWRGRNNLLVSPVYGSQVRLATVLTDLPLPARGGRRGGRGGEIASDCGACRRCVSVCPAGAIADDPASFDLDRCAAQIRRFSQSEKLNAQICGICVRACAPGAGRRRGAGKGSH